jgi:ankyrin repeat protein
MLGKLFSRVVNEYRQSTINNLFESLKYKSAFECKNILALYLDGGGDINVRNIVGVPLLNELIYSHHDNSAELVNFLINRGADVNVKSDDATTPLMMASDNDNIDCVQILLEFGANIDIKDEFNFTALAYALGNLNYEISELLLKNGASLNTLLKDCTYNYINIYEDTSLREFAKIVYNNIPEKSSKHAEFINEKNEKMKKSYLPLIELMNKY